MRATRRTACQAVRAIPTTARPTCQAVRPVSTTRAVRWGVRDGASRWEERCRGRAPSQSSPAATTSRSAKASRARA